MPVDVLATATDDQFELTMDSVGLYDQWITAHKSAEFQIAESQIAEFQIYAKGGLASGSNHKGG